MLKMRLERVGDFEVLAAEDSAKGCKLAVTEHPDVILMDPAEWWRPETRSRRRCEPEIIHPLRWSGWRAARQSHGEHRAFALLARHSHVAAHHARELAGDGEAETGSAEALRGRGISLAELLEQLCLLLGSHAYTGIGDSELDEVAAIGHLACRKLDFSRFGELARIAEEIEQYLPQPHGVHRQCAEVLPDFNDEAVLVLLGKLSGGADDLVDQRR